MKVMSQTEVADLPSAGQALGPFAAPARLFASRRPFRRGTEGVLRAVDFDAFSLETETPPAEGAAFRLRFQAPAELAGVYQGIFVELDAVAERVKALERRGKYEVKARADQPVEALVDRAIAAHQRRVLFLITLTMGGMLWLKWNSLRFFWYTPGLYLYSLVIASYFVSRFYFAARHRAPPMTGYEPTVSVVISVRNEEDAIERTIRSALDADYPPEKREVIVVDDGSSDRTLEILKDLEKRLPALKVVSIPPSGKRFGMAEGVQKARHEIVLFMDSDTRMRPDAMRRIVCGFEDPSLGAAAGLAEVENAGVNALTGLQEIRYFLSFRIMKTAESYFGAVTCCPGCLSAYRREYVLRVLKPWLDQRFLGARATFGDDRSLTNFILRRYRVIYNDKAVCTTLVPETWKRYLIQQVRWKKSWLRETLIAASFMIKKHPVAAISFYAGTLCSLLSPLMVFRAVFWELTDQSSIFVYYVLGVILMGVFQSLYFLKYRPSSRWLLGMLMMASQVVLMGPQTYYAVLTMRKNHWGTR
jgi:hyaluronan synthase